MFRMRKRVLVAGGAGFLGSHMCERLLALGHQVLCVDLRIPKSWALSAKTLRRSSFAPPGADSRPNASMTSVPTS